MNSPLHLRTVNHIRFSPDISFYSTIVNGRYVPLIKDGEVFFPVDEHHLRVLFVVKLIAIAELRLLNKNLNEGLCPVNIQGFVVGDTLSPPDGISWWATIAFDHDETIAAPCLQKGKEELQKLMSKH